MTGPTEQDRQNAERRQAIADLQFAEYQEAYLMALGKLGEGFTPWMKIVLLDSDHRRTGNREPGAVVYKVYRGEQRTSENSVFLRRMPDNRVAVADNYEELVATLLAEKHATKTVEVRGERVPCDRWEVCWQPLDLYRPKSATALADARQRREEKATAKAAEDNPLFAQQILAGELKIQKKPRTR